MAGDESQLDQDVDTFWSLVFDIVSEAETRLALHMAAYDLTPPQFFVLRTLWEHGGRCRIGVIADEHHLTNATMTGLVKRLEAMDPPLVSRQRSLLDKRAVDVALTEAGSQRYNSIHEGLRDQARVLLSLMTADQRSEILLKAQHYFTDFVAQFPIGHDHPE